MHTHTHTHSESVSCSVHGQSHSHLQPVPSGGWYGGPAPPGAVLTETPQHNHRDHSQEPAPRLHLHQGVCVRVCVCVCVCACVRACVRVCEPVNALQCYSAVKAGNTVYSFCRLGFLFVCSRLLSVVSQTLTFLLHFLPQPQSQPAPDEPYIEYLHTPIIVTL